MPMDKKESKVFRRLEDIIGRISSIRDREASVSSPLAFNVCHAKPSDRAFFQQTLKSIFISLPIITILCILGIHYLDIPVAYYCRSLDQNLHSIFDFISRFGISTWYLGCAFILFLFFKYFYKKPLYSKQALFILSSIAIAGVLVDILKFVFGRYRPIMLFENQLYGFDFFHIDYIMTSFPSGHSSTITALMLALYFVYPKHKIVYIIPALFVMMSRVIIGAHFITDVVFGSYVAVITTIFIKPLFKK